MIAYVVTSELYRFLFACDVLACSRRSVCQ